MRTWTGRVLGCALAISMLGACGDSGDEGGSTAGGAGTSGAAGSSAGGSSSGGTSSGGTSAGGSSAGTTSSGGTSSGGTSSGGTSSGGTSSGGAPSGGTGGSGPCGADPAPPGGQCPSACSACTSSNVCVIDCNGGGNCNRTIECPPGFACQIVCDGIDACDTATVNCPDVYSCSLVCKGGNDACGDVQVNCSGGPCRVECAADACQGMDLNCGTGECTATCTGQPAPTVHNCQSSCSCTQC